ncbi:dynein axonemal intermediate chain 3-like [Uloborus diversus]|uniref:dynein axonemal intermediate chain 3-like n=1 Tax=Uloborus diversus TaxID=327109 RepID=UPI002409CB84|nr:dynein axonemal intermediate chain 3-like [Uloborus diversus]
MYLEILPKQLFQEEEKSDLKDLPQPIERLLMEHGTHGNSIIKYKSNKAQTIRKKCVNAWNQQEARWCSEEEVEKVYADHAFGNFLKIAERRMISSLIHNDAANFFLKDVSTLYKNVTEPKINRSLHVIILLKHFDDVIVHKFNPTTPNLVVGGSLSGHLVLWQVNSDCLSQAAQCIGNGESLHSNDDSKPPEIYCSAVSKLEHIHFHGVSDIKWIPAHFEVLPKGDIYSKTSDVSHQIISCGLDGTLKFWDVQYSLQSKPGSSLPKDYHHLNETWEPFHSLPMQTFKLPLSITCFDLQEITPCSTAHRTLQLEKVSESNESSTKISTKFYAGCDNGEVFCGDFKLQKDEKGKFIKPEIKMYSSPHSSPVTAIATSPFLPNVFLSTGSQFVAIWEYNIKTRPILVRKIPQYISCAEWLCLRPAVFILGLEDGSIEVWDLLQSLYEPILVQFVSASAIRSLSSSHFKGSPTEELILAVGDSQGTIYSLALPDNLTVFAPNELNRMEELVNLQVIQIHKEMKSAKDSEVKQMNDTPKKQPVTKSEAVKDEIESSTTEVILEEDHILQAYANFVELQQTQIRNLGFDSEETFRETEYETND